MEEEPVEDRPLNTRNLVIVCGTLFGGFIVLMAVILTLYVYDNRRFDYLRKTGLDTLPAYCASYIITDTICSNPYTFR